MENENEVVICVDCSQEFEITEGWRQLMEKKPDVSLPKRCYSCRQKRKAEREKEENSRDWQENNY